MRRRFKYYNDVALATMDHELKELQSDVARLKSQVSCIFLFMLGVPISIFALFVYRWYESYGM
jgi:hypothetical protein